MRAISEGKSLFRKFIAVFVPLFFFVVGILLILFAFELISHTESSDIGIGIVQPLGILITLIAVIGCIVALVNYSLRRK